MEMITNWPEIIAKKDARIAELEILVKFYEEQFRLSKHRQFGPSSEKGGQSAQLGLFDEAENAANLQKPEPELEKIAYTRRKRIGKRKDDLSILPVETVENKLPEEERLAQSVVNRCMKWDMTRGVSLWSFRLRSRLWSTDVQCIAAETAKGMASRYLS